jgi:VRR-NUC domain
VRFKPPQQTERQFERAVVEYAELNHWLVYHTFDSRRSNPGFPDLVMTRAGALIFAELKTEKGRLSRAQKQWIGDLEAVAGWPTDAVEVFVWRPSTWPEIEEVLR